MLDQTGPRLPGSGQLLALSWGPGGQLKEPRDMGGLETTRLCPEWPGQGGEPAPGWQGWGALSKVT